MRAFIGQFDRLSLGVSVLGAAIGAVWLLAMELGMLLTSITILIACIVLIIRHRWIEIGLLMIAIGLVVVVGYWIFGAPPRPRTVVDPVAEGGPVPTEAFAPGMAGLILMGGLALTAVVAAWDLWEGRRRERLDRRHRGRRERQVADL
ncbi:MAG: hypothetical protein M3153_04940 [Chloroflexota bacterium]|nr:hypothetical protein [Chloroflexota bacterium]